MKPPEHEEAHPNGYETLVDVVARPPRSIDDACNAKRLHPAPGDLSPVRPEGIHGRKAACFPDHAPSNLRASVQGGAAPPRAAPAPSGRRPAGLP